MTISSFGILFIPIALWIFLFLPRYLVPLMVLSSVFSAASVVDFSLGDSVFGIQPFYFAGVLVAIRTAPLLLDFSQLQFSLEPGTLGVVKSLLRFWKWAVLSSFLFPAIFKGVQVTDPRNAVEDSIAAVALERETRPLHWSLENLGQAGYLTLSVIALLYVIYSARDEDQSRRSLSALRITVGIVSIIAVLQSIAAWRGWPFPYDLFNSNPAYAQNFSAMFGDIARVSSTFTEASYAGGFMAAASLGLLAARFYGDATSTYMIFLALIGLLLTTATTGYAAFAIGVVILLIYSLRSSLRQKSSRRQLRTILFVTISLIVAVVLIVALVPAFREALIASTLEKGDTLSFAVRLSLDAYSLRILSDTYGLGAGLGSYRPSSLGAALLGNVGIVGAFLFFAFIIRLFSQLLAASRRLGDTNFAMVAWMLCGLLIAEGLALPDIGWPPLWGILIAATALLASQPEIVTEPGAALESPSVDGELPGDPAMA